MRVEFNLSQLRRELEAKQGRDYSWEEIAKGAGVHLNTIYGLASNRAVRVDLLTLAKLIKFFRSEGMVVEPGNFLVLVLDAPTPRASETQ